MRRTSNTAKAAREGDIDERVASSAKPVGAIAKKRAAYRTLLISVGERVFAERGYEAARMQEIAEQARLALGTVYSVIESKEALYSAIHELRGRELLKLAAAAAAGAKNPQSALLLGVDTYVRFLAGHPDYLRIHLAESQPWALDAKFQSRAQQEQWEEGKALTAAVFRAGMSEGAIEAGDPELCARLMIATHQVFLAHWVECKMKEPLGRLSERMQEHVRRSFFSTTTRGGRRPRAAH